MKEYKVLSGKYRPKKLSEVIGQSFAVKTLKNAFNYNKIAHAFIFTGIRGVGKTTIARIISMGLNCVKEDMPTPEPCGECENCKEILSDRYDDVIEIDAASNTSVDDVREIMSFTKYRPTKGKYKIFIIDEVHMLSNSAFNALLKTIEEPPSFVKFIFCTTELKKIPITIISRCQRYDLKRVNHDQIAEFLKDISKREDIKISSEAITLISRFSEGSIRDSLTILDQAFLLEDKQEISLDSVNKTLGLVGNKVILEIFSKAVLGNTKEAIEDLNSAYNLGASPLSIINDLMQLAYNLLSYIAVPDNKKIFEIYDEENVISISSNLSIPLLNQIWQMLMQGKEEMIKTGLQLEALEIIIIRICYSAKLPSIDEVVKSIKKNNEFPKNIDNNELSNEIKKILDTFPGSKIINN